MCDVDLCEVWDMLNGEPQSSVDASVDASMDVEEGKEDDHDAVQLIELTDPNQLVAVGELRDTDLLKLNGPRDLAGFVLDDKVYIIVASPYDDGVQMIDVTDPSNVTALDGASNGEAGFSELDVADSVETYQMGNSVYAIVASYYDGVQIMGFEPELFDAA